MIPQRDPSLRHRPSANQGQTPHHNTLAANAVYGTIKADEFLLFVGEGEYINLGKMLKEIHAAVIQKAEPVAVATTQPAAAPVPVAPASVTPEASARNAADPNSK